MPKDTISKLAANKTTTSTYLLSVSFMAKHKENAPARPAGQVLLPGLAIPVGIAVWMALDCWSELLDTSNILKLFLTV
jgi:hypothetical protein